MIALRLDQLRQAMQGQGIDAYVVPSFDHHQSEYVADHYMAREWLSGFTGSAGTVVVTQDQALLWTDGRYHTQAGLELAGTPIGLIKQGLPGEPSLSQWLSNNLNDGAVIGFDGRCFSQNQYSDLTKDFGRKTFGFKMDHDLVGPLWQNRPPLPMKPIYDHPLAYAGESRTDKLTRVRHAMKQKGASVYLVPNLDDIAWVLNLRGDDITYCPFFISYLIITENQAQVYVHEGKVDQVLKTHLEQENIVVKAYDQVFEDLAQLKNTTLLIDPNRVSMGALGQIDDSVSLIEGGGIITRFKAVKSDKELANIQNSQTKDGLALMHFHHWLYQTLGTSPITELDIAEKLEFYRRQQPLSMGPSFSTIAGFQANAAMLHYRATPEKHAILNTEGLLLIDSGGQYLDGTTDITRTLALGDLTEEERLDYTLTLKSHIGLAMAVFLKGTCGPHLDVLARKPMWEAGLDYKCGTGHGIGYVSSVHEGPHTVRCNQNDVALELGMLVTNEPGVYKPNKHGIRIENTLLVSLDQVTDFGDFYRFDTISYCPIDTKPLIIDMMTPQEIKWLNAYHDMTYKALAPHLEGPVLDLLKDMTKAIN